MKIGVTVFLREGTHHLWENGLGQNALFLLMLLERLPQVSHCFVVNGGPGSAHDMPCPVLDWAEAATTCDLIIELGAHIHDDWASAFRARGGRIIGMRVANDFAIDMQSIAHHRPPGQLVFGVVYDQIWTLPAFAESCTAWYAHVLRAPVRIMPHLWSPTLIAADGVAHYRPGTGRWFAAIMEPNISTVKTCHVPLLVCEQVFRSTPGFLSSIHLYNADPFPVDGYFAQFAATLDCVRQGLVSFAPREKTSVVLREAANCLVSHTIENAQNYLHYEALFGGYPLIHNSGLLGGCGYRYRDLDCEDGARVMIAALLGHDAGLHAYLSKVRDFLGTLDPTSAANIATYSAAIDAAFQ